MYKNSENYSQYLKTIMETLFSLDQQIKLPKWLIEEFKVIKIKINNKKKKKKKKKKKLKNLNIY